MTRKGASTIVAGVVTGAHGIKGEVRLKSHLVGNLHLAGGVEILLLFPDGKTERRTLNHSREGARGPILAIEGVSDRDAAESLQGVEIAVAADLLPEAEEEEFYWSQLIGLEVYDKKGTRVGTVDRMIDRSGQDLLAVNTGKNEALIPFVEPIVERVDLEEGRIIIDPPEGLLELGE